MPIARLAQLSGKSVADIAVFGLGGAATAARSGVSREPRGERTANGATQSPMPRKRTPAVRTAAGREDFDARILAAIEAAGGPVRSEQIERQVGGTPVHRRAALHRLVNARKVKRAGQARSTTYEAR